MDGYDPGSTYSGDAALSVPRPLLLAALVLAVALTAVIPLGESQARTLNNSTDAAFASMMLPHHEGGVELGQMAATKAQTPQIRALGRSIAASQSRQARTLRSMVRRFDTRAMTSPEARERNRIDMRRLRAATGVAFDRMWLDVISAHHMGAIQMGEMEARGGHNAAARSLARRIVSAQRRELNRFNGLTQQLGG